MILFVVLTSSIYLLCEFTELDEELRSSTLKSIINSQTSCHVHFYNKEKVRIDGEIKPPITIDSHKVKSISIPLTQVKPLKCVILLASKFVKEDVNRAIDKFADDVFRTPFLQDKESNTDIFKSSAVLFAVNFSKHRMLHTISNWRKISKLFRLVGLVHFVESTKNRKPYTNSYIVCRYMGEKVSPLFHVGFMKLMSITVGLQGLDSYFGSYFFMKNAPAEVLPFKSGNYIRRKKGPVQTAKSIFPHLQLSATSIKALTEISILEDLLEPMNATILYSSFGYNNLLLDLEISYMEIKISDDGPVIQDFIKRQALYFSLPVSSVSQSFLTCYHFPVIKYDFYITPFQPDVWMSFLAFFFFMCLALNFLIVYEFGREQFSGFSSFLFVLSTITDDSCGMPEKLRRNWKIRSLFAPWFLISVIFVNCYISLAISSITTPFKLQSIDFFQNLTRMHYNHDEITRGCLWLKTSFANLGDLFPISPRQLDLSNEFRIFSSLIFQPIELTQQDEIYKLLNLHFIKPCHCNPFGT